MGGLRERKKHQTYETLHRVTIELCATHGFAATMVDDIAAAADVSARTFFRYFPTKLDAFLADHPRRLKDLRNLLNGRPLDEPVIDSVGAALSFLRDDANELRDVLLLQAQIAATDSQVLARLLAHHVEVLTTLQ